MIDFYDRNRYKKKGMWNRFCGFMSSLFILVVLLVLGGLVLYWITPWLKTLWSTISEQSF